MGSLLVESKNPSDMKSAGQITDAGTGRALDRAKEAAHHAHARIAQQGVGPEEQAGIQHDFLPVCAFAQRVEKARGWPAAKPASTES